MELIQLLVKYPAAMLIFIAWPLIFVWLLWWTMHEHAKREERLMSANERWQDVIRELTLEIKGITNGLVGRIRDEILKELKR